MNRAPYSKYSEIGGVDPVLSIAVTLSGSRELAGCGISLGSCPMLGDVFPPPSLAIAHNKVLMNLEQ